MKRLFPLLFLVCGLLSGCDGASTAPKADAPPKELKTSNEKTKLVQFDPPAPPVRNK